MDRERREALAIRSKTETQQLLAGARRRSSTRRRKPAVGARPAVRHDVEIPQPPDLKLHVMRDYDLGEIFRYINPVMLYTRHLGFKNFEEALAGGRPRRRANCARRSRRSKM